jgi:hypothetical protein
MADTVGDVAERVIADTADKVAAAQRSIRQLIQETPGRRWLPQELQDAAAEGHGWSGSVMSLAFWELVEAGEIALDESLAVRPQSS